VDFINRIEINTRPGCRREEKNVFPNPTKDMTDKTSSLSKKAPLKPKKKNLIHRSGALRIATIKAPIRRTPNHINEEKNDKAEQRLKLNIKSCFTVVLLIMKSEIKVKRKKVTPKIKPTIKLSRDKFNNKIDKIPPCVAKKPK
jgi:hypothetical protein